MVYIISCNYIKIVPDPISHLVFSKRLYYSINTAKTTAGINHVSPLLTCEPAAVTTGGGVEDDVPEPTTAGVVVVDEPELAPVVVVVSDPSVELSEAVSEVPGIGAADDEGGGRGDDSVGSSWCSQEAPRRW